MSPLDDSELQNMLSMLSTNVQSLETAMDTLIHGDLVSLSTDITSLQTAIEALDTRMEQFHENLAVPGQELHIDNYEGVTANYEVVTLRDAIISATANVYLRRVVFRVYLMTKNPIIDYTSGVNLFIGDEDDNVFLYDTIDFDRHRAINTQDPMAGSWEFDKTFQINDAKLTANKKLVIICRVANLEIDAILFTRIGYTVQL